MLDRLETHGAALRALAGQDGLSRYLRAHGERVPSDTIARAQATISVLLGRVFADQSEFHWDEERFTRAYLALEEQLFAGRTHTSVVAPVLGLDIDSPEVVLGDGLTLVRGETLPAIPADSLADSDVLLAFRAEAADDDADPFAQAGLAFRRVLAALRLYDEGGVALGAVAWTRVDDGPWRAVTLGGGGFSRGLILVEAEDEDELRAFCSLIARRTPRSGELAWALARHGMACERVMATEALSDVLLALRALLGDPDGRDGGLAARVGVLCALPEERSALTARVAHAISLERAIVTGTYPVSVAVETLIDELAGHLRAILRDVLCGHLDTDLRGLADRLIAESEPVTQS